MSFIGALLEYTYNDMMRKQLSVNRLFPTFPSRVKAVAAHGGVRLKEMFPETWHFTVTSGTQEGVKYDVYVRFKNIYEQLKRFVPDRSLWKVSGEGVDYRKLAAEIFNSVDLETSCSCPASLFWGPDFIRTQRDAQYGEPEDRPPKVRNPREYGSLCKHGDLVFEVLPAYTMTFAKHLKQYYSKTVGELEKLALVTTKAVKTAAGELGKRAKKQKVAGYTRSGKPVYVPEPEQEVEPETPETPEAPEEPKGSRPATRKAGPEEPEEKKPKEKK